jgi:hypothetical protein
MQFCHKLSDRQSARVIEQAMHEQVTIRLDPHYSSGLEPFSVVLVGTDAEYLTFRILDDQPTTSQDLIPGQYCQAQFSLGEAVYLLSVHLVDLNAAERTLRTGRPQIVQILERRKFIRSMVAPPMTVTIGWPNERREAQASLFNIGGSGLAFRVGKDLGDIIAIGDVLEARFELPGLPRRFEFSMAICNKTLTSDGTSVIVGAQFQETCNGGRLGDLDELRRFLASQQQASLVR